MEHCSAKIYIRKAVIMNKQFHYSSAVYFNKDPGEEGMISLLVIAAAPVVVVVVVVVVVAAKNSAGR
jgi:hypothetical protein